MLIGVDSMNDQDMIDGFIEEMLFQGYHAWQCNFCHAALWIEGQPLMLMRYGTFHQNDCEACLEWIRRSTE